MHEKKNTIVKVSKVTRGTMEDDDDEELHSIHARIMIGTQNRVNEEGNQIPVQVLKNYDESQEGQNIWDEDVVNAQNVNGSYDLA